jgi:hypothetical protein
MTPSDRAFRHENTKTENTKLTGQPTKRFVRTWGPPSGGPCHDPVGHLKKFVFSCCRVVVVCTHASALV